MVYFLSFDLTIIHSMEQPKEQQQPDYMIYYENGNVIAIWNY